VRLSKGRERRLVQYKRWPSWEVGVDEIRKLTGTCYEKASWVEKGSSLTYSQLHATGTSATLLTLFAYCP
jgi:hypothetical protein